MIQCTNWRISAAGDPYGNRTRVSAVKGERALKTMRRPAFPVLFAPLSFNDLAMRGDKIG